MNGDVNTLYILCLLNSASVTVVTVLGKVAQVSFSRATYRWISGVSKHWERPKSKQALALTLFQRGALDVPASRFMVHTSRGAALWPGFSGRGSNGSQKRGFKMLLAQLIKGPELKGPLPGRDGQIIPGVLDDGLRCNRGTVVLSGVGTPGLGGRERLLHRLTTESSPSGCQEEKKREREECTCPVIGAPRPTTSAAFHGK
ncbi:unnamed protein product [Pleuronectes platessa]|uniref:Uncharacterized protein n=1 Tax=Pleuronectes platessa TaxID=8262 RepID=A0A9N7TJX2_PLEPL|nr:unnamed protein product [Pleuronectes platessa]